MIVFDYERANFCADEIFIRLKFDNWQDKTKALLKLRVGEKVDEVLESFLFLAHKSFISPLTWVLMFIHQFQIISRISVIENPGSVDMLALNQH